eukprot:Nk52_evm22s245 gene=Nk52_evmTU22s245
MMNGQSGEARSPLEEDTSHRGQGLEESSEASSRLRHEAAPQKQSARSAFLNEGPNVDEKISISASLNSVPTADGNGEAMPKFSSVFTEKEEIQKYAEKRAYKDIEKDFNPTSSNANRPKQRKTRRKNSGTHYEDLILGDTRDTDERDIDEAFVNTLKPGDYVAHIPPEKGKAPHGYDCLVCDTQICDMSEDGLRKHREGRRHRENLKKKNMVEGPHCYRHLSKKQKKSNVEKLRTERNVRMRCKVCDAPVMDTGANALLKHSQGKAHMRKLKDMNMQDGPECYEDGLHGSVTAPLTRREKRIDREQFGGSIYIKCDLCNPKKPFTSVHVAKEHFKGKKHSANYQVASEEERRLCDDYVKVHLGNEFASDYEGAIRVYDNRETFKRFGTRTPFGNEAAGVVAVNRQAGLQRTPIKPDNEPAMPQRMELQMFRPPSSNRQIPEQTSSGSDNHSQHDRRSVRPSIGPRIRSTGDKQQPNGSGGTSDLCMQDQSKVNSNADESSNRSKGKVPNIEHHRADSGNEKDPASNVAEATRQTGPTDIVISTTGLSIEQREFVNEICEAMKWTYSKSVTRRTTHLICGRSEGLKYVQASNWRIWRVSMRWLKKCMLGKGPIDPRPFLVAPNTSARCQKNALKRDFWRAFELHSEGLHTQCLLQRYRRSKENEQSKIYYDGQLAAHKSCQHAEINATEKKYEKAIYSLTQSAREIAQTLCEEQRNLTLTEG